MTQETLDQILGALQGLQASYDQLQREQRAVQERQLRLEEGQRRLEERQERLEQRQLRLEMRHECLLGKVADHDVQLRSLKETLVPARRSVTGSSRRAPRAN